LGYQTPATVYAGRAKGTFPSEAVASSNDDI
jgi:hypothetical protein